MLKQLLMHGQCRDIPFNRAPEDMWSEVGNAVAGDGCMSPVRRIVPGPYAIGLYPRDLRVFTGRTSGSSWADYFLVVYTTFLAPSSATLNMQVMTSAGALLVGTCAPAEWTAGGGCGMTGPLTSSSWTGGQFNGWAIVNAPGTLYPGTGNGLFPACYDFTVWPQPANAVIPPGWDVGAGTEWRTYALRPYRDFLIAMQKWVGANNRYETTVFWSDAAAGGLPASWTPTAANFAGDADLNDTPGPLIDGHVLGDDFIIFKPGSCIRMSFTGGSNVFSFATLSTTHGVINRNCIVEYQNRLIVFGPNDIYAIDSGGNVESMMTDGVRRYIYGVINTGTAPKFDACSLCISGAEGRLYATYGVKAGSAYRHAANVAVMDLRTGRWGHLDIGSLDPANEGYFTATTINRGPLSTNATGTGSQSYVWLVGGGGVANTNILCLDERTTAPAGWVSSLQPVTLYRSSLDMDEPTRTKLVTGVRLLVDAEAGEQFTVTVSGQQLLDGAGIETSGSQIWTAGTTEKIDCTVAGKFIGLEITQSHQALQPWKLYGVQIEYTLGGNW